MLPQVASASLSDVCIILMIWSCALQLITKERLDINRICAVEEKSALAHADKKCCGMKWEHKVKGKNTNGRHV